MVFILTQIVTQRFKTAAFAKSPQVFGEREQECLNGQQERNPLVVLLVESFFFGNVTHVRSYFDDVPAGFHWWVKIQKKNH